MKTETKDLSGTHADQASSDLENQTLRKPSTALNYKVIELALEKSPTGGNSRPFKWYWDQDGLIIEHGVKLSAHYLNRNYHASWIALGCLIESVQIAARSQDWNADPKLLPDSLTVRIFFTPTKTSSIYGSRLSALLERSTYRGPLSASRAPEISMPEENTVPQVQVKFSAAEDLTPEFKNFIMISETYIWLQRQACRDFFSEVRFFDLRKNRRGIRSEDLGINKVDQLLLYFFSFVPWILSFIVSIPLLNFNFKQAAKKNLKNAHFVLITSSGRGASHLLGAGEVAIRLWVDLQMQGYVLQPYSAASITLVDAATSHLPADTLSKFKNLFIKTGPEVLKGQFNLQDSEKPIWLFRVGRK